MCTARSASAAAFDLLADRRRAPRRRAGGGCRRRARRRAYAPCARPRASSGRTRAPDRQARATSSRNTTPLVAVEPQRSRRVNGSGRRFCSVYSTAPVSSCTNSKRPRRREPEARRLGDAAQPRAGDRRRLGLLHGQADLHVELGAEAIERFGARGFARDVGRRERRRQRRREFADDAHERVELRARRGAVAIGEQQARDDLGEASRRVARERAANRERASRAAEPAQRLADPRVQSRGERARRDRRRRAAAESGTRSRDRAAAPACATRSRSRRRGAARRAPVHRALARIAAAPDRRRSATSSSGRRRIAAGGAMTSSGGSNVRFARRRRRETPAASPCAARSGASLRRASARRARRARATRDRAMRSARRARSARLRFSRRSCQML